MATGDYITVTEIAQLAVECAGLERGQVEFEYTGGNRGWKGDVPIVRLNTDRIRALGWVCGSGSRAGLTRFHASHASRRSSCSALRYNFEHASSATEAALSRVGP